MYRIVCSDGTVLYDQSDVNGDRVVTEPSCSPEIGQNGGSLSFSMLPAHPAYDLVETMKTYISAEEDGDEIFYGRVTEVRVEKTTGVKQVTCTGAMTFLDDFELTPLKASEQEMDAADFFRYCINGYTEELGDDPKRALGVGIIDHPKSTMRRTFGLTNYQKVKQALDTFIVKEFGGYLRIRRDGETHVVDWIENYGTSNESPIELANNVITHENAITSNDFFTVIHPLGKDGASLPEITVNVDDDLVDEYGRIVRTVSFSNAKNLEELRSDVEEYKTKMAKGLGKTCTVKLIDVHFLDSSVDRLQLGAVYENIAGFEDEGMTVFSMELHFDNPAEDTVTLKNHRELTAVKNGSSTGGKISKIISSAFENIHKHITETAEMLSIHADIIELHGKSIRETATEFERYSRDTDSTIGGILGTGVLQNSDHISQVAGNFTSKYAGVTSTRLNNLIAKGISPKSAGLYEIESIQITEDMIGSGIELFGSPNDALNGVPLDTSSLTVGQYVYRAVLTNDTEVDPQGHYYVKSLLVGTGTEVLLNEYGQQVNVYESIDSVKENLLTITGSALWTNREGITGVAGQFEIETDPETQEQRLVVVSGGGMKIRRDNVEYGLYDEYNLTGGLLVNKINDNATQTKIIGDRIVIGTGQTQKVLTTAMESIENVVGEFEVEEDPETGEKSIVLTSGGGMKIRENTQEFGIFHNGNLTGGIIVDKVNGQGGSGTLTRIRGEFVDIEADQVRVGSTSNVQAWMTETGGDISELQGLVADKATIAQLNAQKARIDTLETDAITTERLASGHIFYGSLFGGEIDPTTIDCSGTIYGESVHSFSFVANGNDISDPLVSASVDGDTLTLTKASGATVTFKKGPGEITLSGAWTDDWTRYTVTAYDKDGNQIGEPCKSGPVHFDEYSTRAEIKRQLESSSTHTAVITAEADGHSLATVVADASGVYSAGWAEAQGTVGDFHITPGSGVVTIDVPSATVGSVATKSGSITLSQGDWSTSGTKLVTAYFAGSEARTTTVDIGSPSNWSSAYVQNGKMSVSCFIAGKAISSGAIDDPGWSAVTISDVAINGTPAAAATKISVKATASNGATGTGDINISTQRTNAYNAGWSGSYDAIGISATTSSASYGDTITIYPTGKSSSTASAGNITSKKFTYTVPADRYNAGYNSAKLKGSWSSNKWTVTKVSSGSTSDSLDTTVTAAASISYDTSTHKYTATAKASAGGAVRDTKTSTGGTEAYNAGYNQGELDGIDSVTISDVAINGTPAAAATKISVKATASNGATGTGDINISTQRTNAYNAGWSGSYDAIGISATTSSASYGDTITIYPTGKSSSTASAGNITSKKFTYTVPADRYKDGAGSVTLTVGGWQNGANRVRASNGQYKDVTLPSFSTSGGTSFTNHKTTVYFATASVTGPLKSVEVDATSEYTAGYNSAKLKGSWSSNKWTVTKVSSGSTSDSLDTTVTAAASISYDTSTHKYTATAKASAGGAVRDTKTSTGGTEAYNAGYNQGELDGIDSVTISKVEQQGTITYSSGNYSVPVNATASNSATGSGTITFAATAAYNAGWNAARSNQSTIGTCYTITAHNGDWVKVSSLGTGYSRVPYKS